MSGKKIISPIEANELLQLAIDDCDNWEDWDTSDRSNFENMGTNLGKVQDFLKVYFEGIPHADN